MSDTHNINMIESEDEDESEDDMNENLDVLREELPTNEFCNHITQSKYKLYELIVLGPKDEESDDAQDNTLLESYIKELDHLGKSIIKIINSPINSISSDELNEYSVNTNNHVNDTIHYTNTFFKQNKNINKMLYIDYINNQFSIYPFFQLPYFPKYE